ncbi:MAG: endolytic transglycosylase MltG [Acetivibrionales bacterium]
MGNRRRGKFAGRLFIKLFVFLLIVGVGLYFGRASYNYVINGQNAGSSEEIKKDIDPDNAIEVDIPSGSSTDDICTILVEKGIIKGPLFFKILSKINGYDGTYMSGTHLVKKGYNYNTLTGLEQLMGILSSTPVSKSIRVTIPEGFTYDQIVDLLHSKGVINKEKFNEAANNASFEYEFLNGIPEGRKPRLEGYLFPDTYDFDAMAGEKAAIEVMLRNFNNKFKPEYYERAEELNMSVDDIVILASIIEREARIPEDRDIISGVFYNRLNSSDMTLRKLQSCATIQYIFLKKEGKVKDVLLEEDTKVEDPYNTYIIEGLPPGPISNPGEASLIAALYPEKTDYLYFVAKGDGGHVFSDNYRDHVNAVNKYGLN